jgi:hypothetical protein
MLNATAQTTIEDASLPLRSHLSNKGEVGRENGSLIDLAQNCIRHGWHPGLTMRVSIER